MNKRRHVPTDVSPFCIASPGGGSVEDGVVSTYNKASISGDFFMRIGLFTDTYLPDLNGVANSTNILFRELRRQGHEAYVIAPRKGVGAAQWNEDHTVLRLAGIKLKQLYGYVATTPLHLNALEEIGRLHLDVIHAQTEFGVGFFARMCAQQFGIPIVITYHTMYEDYTHYANLLHSEAFDEKAKQAVAYLTKLYANASVEVIAPSIKTEQLLERYHVSTNIHVVPTGLELDRFDPAKEDKEKTAAIRNEVNVYGDEKLIVYVGRIAEEKSLDLVVRGFAMAADSGVPVHLMVIGGGPDLEKLKDLAGQLGASGKITFLGPKPAVEVPDYYRASDAFVSASRSETQGMTFIEAMASGLPLLARTDEVLKDIVVEGKTGWYFETEEDLAACLKRFAAIDADTLSSLKKNCLAQVQPLSAQVFCEKALAVYQEAIDNYETMVKIADVAVKDDIVKLTLSDLKNKKDETLYLTLEDYAQAGLRKGGRISARFMLAYQKKQEAVLAYQRCMQRIAVKDRSIQEVRDWLKDNTKCSAEEIDAIVSHLKGKGYLDDERYCLESVTSMRARLLGHRRIEYELHKRGISDDLIQKALAREPDREVENAMRSAERISDSITGVSVRHKKEMLRQKLMTRGYDSDTITQVIGQMDFGLDESAELDALRKCAAKAKKRYEKKYKSTQLRNTVFRYCAAQGFDTEDIYVILDEMKWGD